MTKRINEWSPMPIPAGNPVGEPVAHILTAEDNVACQAFALCVRPSVGAVRHPVLGAYLSCQECADKLEQEIEPAEIETRNM